MEYERIHKPQMGVISPSKLRMKLLGAHNQIKKGGNSSSRTSPSKVEDMECAKDSLLAIDLHTDGAEALHDIANLQAPRSDFSAKEVSSNSCSNQPHSFPTNAVSKGMMDMVQIRMQTGSKNFPHQAHPNNLSMIHPVRTLEDNSNVYDSGHDNVSSSGFEFHRVERTSQHPMVGSFARHLPSKWNDAEKWIVNRQKMHPNVLRKTGAQNQGSHQVNSTWLGVAPESMVADQKHSVMQVAEIKRIDSTHTTSQNVVEKFSVVSHNSNYSSVGSFDFSPVIEEDPTDLSRLQEGLNTKESSVMERSFSESKDHHSLQPVSMRDVGTEMTPIPSQEPSRTGTPLGSTPAIHSPISSMSSTPRREAPAPSPAEATGVDDTESKRKVGKHKLSEKELKLKTRREIAALGMQLGKMNIASWASKEEAENASPTPKTLDVDQVKMEYEARAAAWGEAENSKHMARYKHEEVKIQAWESHQKAKFEAEMMKLEVQAEQMRACALEKMAAKLEMTKQRAAEKQAAAEERMNHQAARTAQKAEQMRRTGRIPSSKYLCCNGFF